MSDEHKLSRREFFRSGGPALLGLSLAACERGERDPFSLDKPPVPGAESWQRHEERDLASACLQCAAGCGIRVRVVEGRAVSIRGETDNPINRGGIGPRGRSGVQVLYDPDRIRQPLRRKGPRGSGTLEPVSWDDALAELADRLGDLRARGEPHRVAVVCNRERGMMLELWERFSRTYGTPNFFDGVSRGCGPVSDAIHLMQGVPQLPAYDWTSTRYVLSLGAGILEASCQAIYFARAAAYWRRGRPLERARIVHVEPSFSRTAANADIWISITPGTYAAFALGVAHVLVRDGTYDRSFVDEHCFGFDDWTDEESGNRPGLRRLILEHYSPEQAGRVCGIEASAIEEVGAQIAEERPAFAITDPRATHATNGLHTAMAVHALNALLGSIDRPGGVLVQRPAPLAPWPEPTIDDVARRGLDEERLDGAGRTRPSLGSSAVEALPDALLSGRPYAVDTVLLYYANPLYAWVNPQRWRDALAKVPFVVTFSPFLDETTTEAADLVLPDHTYLERWEDAAPAPSIGRPVFGVRRNVVEPLHETRATGDVVVSLARDIGGSVGKSFPWEDFRRAFLQRVVGIHQAGTGSIQEDSVRSFLRELVERGFWTDPDYPFERWDEVLRTPSGKLELYSLRLARELDDIAARAGTSRAEVLKSWGRAPHEDVACMPHHEEIRWQGNPQEYPLLLEAFQAGTYAEGSGANLPFLQELVTEPGQSAWTTKAEIHPRTAHESGIRDGDRIEIESPVGRISAPVHLHRQVREGVVRIPRGGGHRAFGRFATGRGANPMEILVPVQDPFGAYPAVIGTRVRIRRVAT